MRSLPCRGFGYRTEIGIRISTEEATGLPSSIAGKNRQRRSASIRFRLSAGLSVGCTSSTTELPSAATSNRATATTSIFWRRRSSGRSGSGLKRARAESLPPPRRVAGGCAAASLGTAALRHFPMPCSARFLRAVSRDALEERAERALGAGGSVREASAPLPVRAEPLGARSDLGVPQFERQAAPCGRRGELAPRSPAGIRGGAQTRRGLHREASTGAAAKDCPQFVRRGLENSVPLDRDQEVLRARFTRAKHRLNHDAVRGASVRGH